MVQKRTPLTQEQIAARRRNAKKSTGPRTAAGKRRARFNALKHGLYSQAQSLWDSIVDLGEDPREFQRFLRKLIVARQPADAVEMMLLEDIAVMQWKKARLARAQAGVQVCNLETLELERHRQALEVGRDSFRGSQAETLKTGLRRAPDSPAKFEEILSFLDLLVERVEKKNFSEEAEPVLGALYGEDPTLRGAQIINLFRELGQPRQDTSEDETLRLGLRRALLEEIRDMAEE